MRWRLMDESKFAVGFIRSVGLQPQVVTLITIAADPEHLGARIGVLSVLHTWGSALTHPPHVHMIVAERLAAADRSNHVSCPAAHGAQRPDCLAGVVGLELRNPCASHVFEMS
jgi:hypothetical protein